MGAFAVPLLLVVLLKKPRHLLIALPLVAAPFAVYVLAMLLSVPDAFLFDLQFTLTRLGGRSLSDQINGLALNFTRLLAQDFWLLAALVGLFGFGPGRRLRMMTLLLLLLPIAVIGRTNALYDLSAYYFIPFLPLVALGAGCFLYSATLIVWRTFRQEIGRLIRLRPLSLSLIAGVFTALLIGAPLRTSLLLTVGQINDHLPTSIDPILLNPTDTRAAADYVNAALDPEDLVIASPGVAWLIEGQAADFQMAIAASGQATPHFPADVPADRWAYDPQYEGARFRHRR